MLKCSLCGTDRKKYVVYDLPCGQVTLCKSCLSLGMRSPSGTLITRTQETLSLPSLGFPASLCDRRYCDAASAEGWAIVDGTDPEVDVITSHYYSALLHRYFIPTGQWLKDVSVEPVECFRRSCANIRDYYMQWLKARGAIS